MKMNVTPDMPEFSEVGVSEAIRWYAEGSISSQELGVYLNCHPEDTRPTSREGDYFYREHLIRAIARIV